MGITQMEAYVLHAQQAPIQLGVRHAVRAQTLDLVLHILGTEQPQHRVQQVNALLPI
jgi:hypothetical protein